MEADVVMGRIYGDNDTVPKRPVMAHPPDVYSDITLEQFIQSILKVFFISISCWKLARSTTFDLIYLESRFFVKIIRL